jgi:hypothetical protein
VIRRLFTFSAAPDKYTLDQLIVWLNKQFTNLMVASAQVPSWVNKTANYTASKEDAYIFMDATAGALTVTVPLATTMPGVVLTIKKIDASANAVTIAATIDGAASPTLATQYKSKTIQSDGTRWNTIASI